MPLNQIKYKDRKMMFRGEKVGEHVVSVAEQSKLYEVFEKNYPDEPMFVLFSSSETDEYALNAASNLIHSYMKLKPTWSSFQFVNPTDTPPWQDDEVADMYVLMGVNENDPLVANQVRRWVRGRLGVPVFVCLTATKPADWFKKVLGVQPDFIFSLKSAGVSVG